MKTFRTNGWRRLAGAAVVAGALAACGGGSGGGGSDPVAPPAEAPTGPPATAAALADTTADAVDVTQAAVAAADGLVSRGSTLNGLSAVLGAPVTGAAPDAGVALVRRSSMMRVQAVTTAGCTEVVDAPCSGSARLDTDIDDSATSVAAGQYLDVTFNAIAGFLFGESIAFDGRLRVEFLTAFSESAQSIAGLGLRLRADGLTVTAGGVTVGPITEVADVRFDANAQPSVVVDGARYGALSSVEVTGEGTYTIGSGSARLGYGSKPSTAYVNVSLNGWNAQGGRPLEGSAAVVTVPNWRATVTVVSATGSTVAYDVSIVNTGTGASGGYRVTATYPSDGGAPSYVAVGS